jgi:uncharacterized protein YbjT (DUF2867 family)
MIEQDGLPATILRPNAYMQNVVEVKDALLCGGIYPMPWRQKGVSTVDVRDIADVAVLEILRRTAAKEPLDREVYDLVGPDVLTGPSLAELWSEVLKRPIRYGGDELEP